MISLDEIKKYTEKTFARSSGAGGQNVNKTSTKVFLVFDILRSPLKDFEKQRLSRYFPNGFIQLSCQETRSQAQNIAIAFEQLERKISQCLFIQKARQKVVPKHLTRGGKANKAKKARLQKYKNRYLA